VVVNGARQVGKSTLVGSLPYRGRVELVTLDDPAAREAATVDPRAFLQRDLDTLVIDEAQLEPRLFRALKAEVDRDRKPGRFLLTGSSRLLEAPGMAEALVGRVETVELWPFSQDELMRAHGAREKIMTPFVDTVFDEPRSLLRSGRLGRNEIIERICVGGFPEAVLREGSRRTRWFQSYVTTSLMKVVKQLADIERLSEIPRLFRLCAARSGTELNVANVASDFGIPARTVSAYLAHLSSAFFIQLIPAWSTNLSAKVSRRPKLVVVDSGLVTHLLGTSAHQLHEIGSPLGPILETFVVMELRKQLSWSEHETGLFHFRDRSGVEVDAILERSDGRIVGIEIKATSSPRLEDFSGLRFLADRLGDRFAYGVLFSMAPEATPFGPRMAALPIEMLWRK
jgi:uncharacterized protein